MTCTSQVTIPEDLIRGGSVVHQTAVALMRDTSRRAEHPLRVGSLVSGYGGLDLAVEHVMGAKTVWFSELNEPVARDFAHH